MQKLMLITGLAVICALPGQANALLMSSDDLWDVRRGTTVTASSPVLNGSNIRNMFGDAQGWIEAGIGYDATLFSDNYYAGYTHYVEWQTIAPVTIRSFNLVANHDGDTIYNANQRGFSKFALFAKLGSDWEELYEYYPTNPYGGGANYTHWGFLELYAIVPETTAQNFRAEFVQYGDSIPSAMGPRIQELDGYATVIPEPATLLLLGLGAVRLRSRQAVVLRKRT